jgi:hypothetical protein
LFGAHPAPQLTHRRSHHSKDMERSAGVESDGITVALGRAPGAPQCIAAGLGATGPRGPLRAATCAALAFS